MSRARDLADSADKDVTGTLTTDGLTVAGNVSVDGGTIKLDGNYPTGTTNTALGDTALDSVQSGGGLNVAIGQSSLTGVTTGDNNTGVGAYSGITVSTSSDNSYFGAFSGYHQTGAKNTALGYAAMNGAGGQSSGSNNTAFGYNALTQNTSSSNNTAVGYAALIANTTGTKNFAAGYNSGIGTTTGQYNTFVGADSGASNTTASFNTFVGSTDGTYGGAGGGTTGDRNTFIGNGSGARVSTGYRNTILGRYNGNQGGLNISAAYNHIVLSDGDGNPRLYLNANGTLFVPQVYNDTTGSAANMFVNSSGVIHRSTSSQRYKNTINDATHGLTELLALRPVTYKGNNDGDTVFGGLIAEEVHDAGLTEFVQYDDDNQPDALAYGNMVSLCIKAIQEQQATITALEARIATLEAE